MLNLSGQDNPLMTNSEIGVPNTHVCKDLIYDNIGLLVKYWFYNLNVNT